jgi:ABC-type lipoprotein export system ATPase subunit
MKIKPVVTNNIQTSHTCFVVDLELRYNITFIIGDSGVGKSAVYSFIEELGTEDKRIRCFNYLDLQKLYKKSIRSSKGKLFVIDNADILLDDRMREYIATDPNNQYIIIGRNPTGLLLVQDNIYELSYSREGVKTIFRLKKAFS